MSTDVPANTYRLQLTPPFTLRDAAQAIDHLHRLGVDAVSLSPLLHAEPGSAHGDDVVDPSGIDDARGGPDGLRELADAAHSRGMRVIAEIVPGHLSVATPAVNPWWWDVLRLGPASPYAGFFDIDWDAGGGRLCIPALGDGADEETALRVEDGELRYRDNRYPIAPGTGSGSPWEVHARQHYELVSSRRAGTELNYRCSCGVSTLAGVRVERPDVFDATHTEIARWLRDGLVDGLLIVHPDGLLDPGGYLRRLAALARDTPIWVEKVLATDERMPDWPVEGTTGSDALATIDRVFVDPAGDEPLRTLAAEADNPGERHDGPGLVHQSKRAAADGMLRSEVLRVARELRTAGAPAAEADLADAVAELAAAFPVSRSYLPFGAGHLRVAWDAALAARPDLAAAIGAAVALLSGTGAPAARFQQLTAEVGAKGVEGSAFSRFSRLVSLAETSGDPTRFAVPVDAFHRIQAERLEHLPHSLTALTTHATTCGEDARARIAVLAELPARWAQFLAAVRKRVSVGDGLLENLLWQSVVGAWPASRERLLAYAATAVREAGVREAGASRADPDPAFEARLDALVDAVFDDERVRAEVAAIDAIVTDPGASNGLGATLVQLTVPGIPDVYQGSERWERSLADPNRRPPVEFEAAAALLAHLDDGWRPQPDSSGAAKVLVTSRALRLRRDRPELFTGYRPLPTGGPRTDHLLAFDRGGAVTLATRLPVGLAAAGGWAQTTVDLGDTLFRNELTGREHRGRVHVADVLATYPVALLTRR